MNNISLLAKYFRNNNKKGFKYALKVLHNKYPQTKHLQFNFNDIKNEIDKDSNITRAYLHIDGTVGYN